MLFDIVVWGWVFGNGALGIGDWSLSPLPNPQSPIPNPQYVQKKFQIFIIYIFITIYQYKKNV